MIDVHIIRSDRPYFEECLKSLETEDINLHFLEHNEERYGQLRIEGFSKGDCPYIAAIDDDDIVIEGIFQRAKEILDQGIHTAYYSNHYVMNENGEVYGKRFAELKPQIGYAQAKQMHHVVVYRRDVVEPVLKYLDGIQLQDKLLLNLKAIHDGPVFGEDRMGLYWRVHDKNMHKTRSAKNNPPEWHKMVNHYKRVLLSQN